MNDQVTDRPRHNRQGKAETPAHDTPTPVVAPTAIAEPVLSPVTIDGHVINLPNKFVPGHVLTANETAVLNLDYSSQFANNQNAMAKARAKAFAAAKTDEERAKYVPLSADEIAARWPAYEHLVGDATRMSTMEKIKHDAGWRAWAALVSEHNAAVKAGEAPVIAKAGTRQVPIQSAPRKLDLKATNAAALGRGEVERVWTEEELTTAHKDAVAAFEEARIAFVARFLAMPEYAGRVQLHLDAIMAERGAKKETTPAVETVDANELF